MASKREVKVSATRGGKRPKREIERIVIEPGANGGHTVKHHYKAPKTRGGMGMPAYEDPESFPFSNKADTMQHLDQNLPGPSVMGQDEPDADNAGGASDNDADNQGQGAQE